MKKRLLFALLAIMALLQAQSQNLNSGLSGPVVIDTKPPQVQVISPNGGETVNLDQTLLITWQGIDDHLGSWPVKIGYSTTQTGDITWIDQDFANSGQVELAPPQVATTFAKIHIRIVDIFGNEGYDVSDDYFTIFGCEPLFAYAGADTLLCPGDIYFTDAWAVNYDLLHWRTFNGNGYFENENELNTTYFPSPEDYQIGCVSLILTVMQEGNCYAMAEDTMELCFSPAPTANAGPDTTICNIFPFYLQGEATNAMMIYWTSSGDGYFDSYMSTYTPGPNDVESGVVTLRFAAMPFIPCVMGAEDEMILYITQPPFVEAQPGGSICEFEQFWLGGIAENYESLIWTTSGDGTFEDPNSINTIYHPGPYDILVNYALLTITASPLEPCYQPAYDEVFLQISRLALVDAGEDATTCGTEGYQLSGIISNVTGVHWFSSGDGVFDNPDIPTPIYTPGINDLDAGSVNLHLMGESMMPCPPMGDDMVLYIQSQATVNAGPETTEICEDGFVQLVGMASAYSNIYWTTTGDGTFEDENQLVTSYFPGNNDIENGQVTLTLTVEGSGTCGGAVSDSILVTIQKLPVVFAGNDVTVTGNGSYSLLEANAEYYEMLDWTTSGDGNFDNSMAVNPIYTPGPIDLVNGCVTLTLAAFPNIPCSMYVEDAVTLCYENLVTGVSASQRIDGSRLVDIFYDLKIQDPILYITAEISLDGGTTFQQLNALTGDVGPDVIPGLSKYMVWDAGMDLPGVSSDNAVFKITAGLDPQFFPAVTTTAITNITTTTASSGGNVTSDGGAAVTARGVCWSTAPNPTIADSKTTNGSGTGAFTSSITGLINNTTYFVRAYATNSGGTAYGNELSLTTLAMSCPSSFTDSRDSKVYTAVLIGNQCWMKQNLNIGTRIAGTIEQTNNGTIEKYCYDNTEANCTTFGGLYQWNEMMQYSTTEGVKGICPTGWHLPTDDEWSTLIMYISSQSAYQCNSISSYIAKSMASTSGWNTSSTTCAVGNNQASNNATVFTGLPGGCRTPVGSFNGQASDGNWWYSSQYEASNAWNRVLIYNTPDVDLVLGSNKAFGYSVRCLKDN